MELGLKGKVALVTGSSRGIGRGIALGLAEQGCDLMLTARDVKALEDVAQAIRAKQGKSAVRALDLREPGAAETLVEAVRHEFGGLDILVNNASALYIANTLDMPMKRFDLIFSVNVRATFLCSQACIPHLKKSSNPHILNLSPPLNMDPKWFKDHLAYTMSKYGMSMCTLGMAEEFKKDGVAVNSLWPETAIATAAVANLLGGDDMIKGSRKPEIVADAAHEILIRPARGFAGKFLLDEDVLREAGVNDFSAYAVDPSKPLLTDLFVD